MFQNYHKLFLAYADYYKSANFFGDINLPSNEEHFNCNQTLSNLDSRLTIIDDPRSYFNNHLYMKENQLSELTCDIGDNFSSAKTFNDFEFIDVVNVMVIFLNFIFAKRYLSNYLKNSILLDKLGLRKKDRAKLDECIWRLLFYTISSCWLIYSCFIKRQSQKYLNSKYFYKEYTFDFDLDEYLISIIEIGFYLHAVYATVFEDIWRKDSSLVIIHHMAAIFTFMGVYITKTHRVALVAVVLRDTCDVILEVGKLNMSLKIQHGKVVKSLDQSLKVFLVIFAAVFVINQLYFYPLFCLYHALNIVHVHSLESSPIVTGIITCALVFLILDLFWFMLIARLLFRLLFCAGPLTDVREYDHEDEERELMKHMADNDNVDANSETTNSKPAHNEMEKIKSKCL